MHTAVSTAYTDVILCRRSEGDFLAGICLLQQGELFAQDDLVSILHPSELVRYDDMQFEKLKKSYLIGRFAAKLALGALFNEKDLSRFNIRNGIFNRPVVSYREAENVQVSISHSNKLGAALAFSELHPMAIDIEKISTDVSEVIQTQLTAREKENIIISTNSQELNSPYYGL